MDTTRPRIHQLKHTDLQAFPERIINTFTGKNFEKCWPKRGQRLGRSGYRVAVSHLEEITPLSAGIVCTCPAYSGPLWSPAQNLGEETLQKTRVKRFWFNGSLILGWDYRQKRVETLTFTLPNSLQPFFQKGPTVQEKLHIPLEDISPHTPLPFWSPHTFYDLDYKIQHQEKIYRCQGAHHSGYSFESDCQNWAFDKDIPTALGNPSRASFFNRPGPASL